MKSLFSRAPQLGLLIFPLAVCALSTQTVFASFHFMQIEQIIGGVNGDNTAQAIQLRMRSGGQSVLSLASVRAFDATGSNEVVLENMTSNVSNGAGGSRVLITTPNFANYTDIPLISDFVMDPIPTSYLDAGRVTFEDSGGSIAYWSISWGGSSYTGSTTGSTTNDADGNFGPPVDIALPSSSLQALLFQGAANALSTTNLADYALTSGAATFVNNAGTSFTLVAPQQDTGDFDNDGDVDGQDFLLWQRGGSPAPLSNADLTLWQNDYGTIPSLPAVVAIPEPECVLLFCLGLVPLALLRPHGNHERVT